MDADIDTLGLKDLKALIAQAGLKFDDCIDKADLRARAREAQAALLASAPQAAAAKPSAAKPTKLGGYDVIVEAPADVLRGEAAADLLIVMLHGLGATNRDLAGLAGLFVQAEPKLAGKKLAFVFPQAPLSPIGAAWWNIDIMGFMSMSMNPDPVAIGKFIRVEPAGFDACRSQMAALITDARALVGGGSALPAGRLLMAGFSQGAITALDIALQRPEGESVAGVVFMNGAPMVVEQWAERLKVHKGLKVHVSGGMMDQTLPVMCTDWTHDLLKANGADVRVIKHAGGHDVGGPDVINRIARFVVEAIGC